VEPERETRKIAAN